jgi:beta-glucosidase
MKALALSKQWDELAVPLHCFHGTDLTKVTQPMTITTAGALDITISGVHLGTPPEGVVSCR